MDSDGDSLERHSILGVRVIAEPLSATLDAVDEVLASDGRRSHCLCPTGVHGVVEAHNDELFRRILNEAKFNIPDGMPLVRLCQRAGFPKAERTFGPDVMWLVLERSRTVGSRHFFYGGKEGVAKELAQRAVEHFPGLQVSGWFSPPFRPLTETEKVDLANRINESGSDVVWVGLSTPKQERWAWEMRERLNVKLICTVGAAFDYHTGSVVSAPQWMKTASLEWAFRLAQEPKRLWRRYLEIVPKFLYLVTLEALGARKYDDS